MTTPYINRDSHVIITRSGGLAGRKIELANVTLDKLSDDDFATAKELLEVLASAPKGRPNRVMDGYNYTVAVGAKDADAKSLTSIFNLRGSVGAPKELAQLKELLAPSKGRKPGM